jgi:hypothetical protein
VLPYTAAMRRVIGLALLGALVIVCDSPAFAQDAHETPPEPEYTLEEESLRVTQGAASIVVDLGCPGRSTLRIGAKLLVACGTAGVVEFDLSDPLSPRRDGTMPVDGIATGLFLHDGVAWVEVSQVDARPVRIGAPSPTLAPASPAPIPSRKPAPTRYLPPIAADDIPPGDAAKEPQGIVAPPRQGGLWELSFLTSAFVAFGSLGAGLLGSASVAYRFEAPLVLRAQITPFGVAGPSSTTRTTFNAPPFGQTTTGSGGAVTVFATHLLFGLDTQYVEASLGFGGATVNENTAFRTGGGSPATGAASIVEAARIGARDGLALYLESSTIAVNQKFDLGYFVSTFQIPVTPKVMLVLRGGGGNVGFGYGDLGVRVVVRGDGGKGTLALTGFAGGALIQLNLCSSNPDPPFASACNSANLGGPSLGGGVEWKL